MFDPLIILIVAAWPMQPKIRRESRGGGPASLGGSASTMECSGDAAGSLTAGRDAVAALLQMLAVFSAMSWRRWW
jgi:hypothetical protein